MELWKTGLRIKITKIGTGMPCSSGFNNMAASKNKEKAAPTEILPSAVHDEIENSMPYYYEFLIKHRMKLP